MDLDRAVETWRYLLGLTQVWPPPTVISDGSPLLQKSTLDEIIAFLQNQDRDTQAMMTLGFISLIRFLMAEVAEACHTAAILAAGLSVDCEDSGDEVEVEVHDEGGFMQLWWESEETDETWLMQRDRVDKMDRWHRLLHALQKELTQQSKEMRRSHLMQLRARIFHVTIPGAWMPLQDQLYALVLGMMDEDRTHPIEQDDRWMEEWSRQLAEFVPGLQEPVTLVPPLRGTIALDDTPPGQMGDEEIQAHLVDEANYKKAKDAEEAHMQAEMERLQAEEDEMLRRQAALYRAWEEWELAQHMQGGGGEGRPKIRKRCVLEIEVASSSTEGRRTQVVTVPENGSLTIKLHAAMVDEVAESEIATVELDPQQPASGRGLESLDFNDFQAQYQLWTTGALTSNGVVQRFGEEVLEMMEAQYAACRECDADLDLPRDDEGGLGTRTRDAAPGDQQDSPLAQTQMDGDMGRELAAQGEMPGGSSEMAETSGLTVTTVEKSETAPSGVGFKGESGFKGDSG